MSNRDNIPNQRGFQILQIDRAESAFHELGWRIDRQAAEDASRDVRKGTLNSLINSPAWTDKPPKRVDKFKGKAIAKMMKNFLRRNVDSDSNSDSDIESSDSDESEDDSSDDDNDDDDNGGGGASDNSGSGSDGGLFVRNNERSSWTRKGKGKATSKTDPRERRAAKSLNTRKGTKSTSREKNVIEIATRRTIW